MTIDELIERLQSATDKSLEVVIRVGDNHGANIVCRTSYWTAIPNPNHTRISHPCDVLLPDNPDYAGGIQVLVIG